MLTKQLDRTPLHWAAMHGHTDMIRYLLEHKCAIEPEDKVQLFLFFSD